MIGLFLSADLRVCSTSETTQIFTEPWCMSMRCLHVTHNADMVMQGILSGHDVQTWHCSKHISCIVDASLLTRDGTNTQ